jgi:hypothetical protein
MAALAHSHGDEPQDDPAEAAMSGAAFQIIQRAHEICGHPPARELPAELEQRVQSALTEGEGCLIAHATKIMRAEIRAGELLREMKERAERQKAGEASAVTDWGQVARDAWHSEGWTKAAEDYHTKRGKRRTIVDIEPEKLQRLRALLDDDVSLQRAYAELSSSHIKGRAFRRRGYAQ